MDGNGDTNILADRNLPYSASPDVIVEEVDPSLPPHHDGFRHHQQPKLHITPSFKETDQHMYRQNSHDSEDERGQIFQQFDMQKADFESKSGGSETASEGRQPSHYRRSDLGFSQQSPQPNKSIAPSHHNPFSDGATTRVLNGGTGTSAHIHARKPPGADNHQDAGSRSPPSSDDDESVFSDKQLEELYQKRYEQQQSSKKQWSHQN